MKKLSILAAFSLFLFSCTKDKEETPVTLEYTNFNNTAITSTNHINIDINKDGVNDFYATTGLSDIGENVHLQFLITAQGANRVLIQGEETPKLLEKDEVITKANQGNYEWSPINPALIVEKVMPMDPAASFWQGTWKDKSNKYLPVQVAKEGKIYNGWIQISFSSTTPFKIIIHDAAVSKVADVNIKAGQK